MATPLPFPRVFYPDQRLLIHKGLENAMRNRKVESVDRMHFEGSYGLVFSVSLYTFYLSINAKSYSLVIRAVSKVWRLKPCQGNRNHQGLDRMRMQGEDSSPTAWPPAHHRQGFYALG